MSKPPAGRIRFHKWCEPPLAVGDYKVKVTQSVDHLAKDFSGELSFSVASPAFSLNPTDVYSVYPPDGSRGEYAESLPHIVFTRRTMPWERNLVPGAQPEYAQPWMALLLLSEEDFDGGKLPPVEPGTVANLMRKADLVNIPELADKGRPDNVAGPKNLVLKPWELKDPCNSIDLKLALFRKLAPQKDDLKYLAHVREVNTDRKETLSFLADGWFSVVIGNRFPRQPDQEGAGGENRALLVSLEGMQDYLPDSGVDAPEELVRLAVLASWTFECDRNLGFIASMQALEVGPLHVPFAPDPAVAGKPAEEEAQQYVGAAFSRGYAALNHNTRRGEKTVSWYRGPLTPVTISRAGRYEFAPSPDALVRYDPDKGMMDLTYAAASQLGRMLGLQDRAFAQALCEWRTEVQGQSDALMRREELRRALNSGSVSREGPESQFLLAALDDAIQTKAASGEPEAQDPDRNLPAFICRWLARRLLLYGVPFTYLVPDETMLGADSLRFFSLDPGWIKCLLEGACSVGRDSSRQELPDELLRDRFFDLALAASPAVRGRPQADGAPEIAQMETAPPRPEIGKPFNLTLKGTNLSASGATVWFTGPDSAPTSLALTGTGEEVTASGVVLAEGSFMVTVKSGADDTGLTSAGVPLKIGSGPSSVTRCLEGFLLRSPVVKGWQGLEMEATGTDGKPVTPLRIDRLSPDIMICIYNGPVKEIEVRQPPEGMHFGATLNNNDHRYSRDILRNLNEVAGEPGEQITLPESERISVPLRADVSAERVIKVRDLALSLANKLPGKPDPQSFTSAEFGVQMTQSPGRVTISVRGV